MFRNREQNKKLHALIGELKIDAETKEDLVHSYTGGRTTSSSKMLVHECANLISHLESMSSKKTQMPNQTEACQKMRKKIFSICYEMQWTLAGKLDWSRINFWLNKYGYLHKKLDDYTEAELPKLVTQFENLLKSYYAKG
ncbi:MAG TPA: hypothetical protein VN698_09625 [Bacteroidia bacterium]|nr:hypothetical protein [Bacteroidia bacterium]